MGAFEGGTATGGFGACLGSTSDRAKKAWSGENVLRLTQVGCLRA